MADARGDGQKALGVPASALFRPWFAGQLTVVPFLVGLWLPWIGLSLKWSCWAGTVAVVVSFALLGLVAEGWGKRRALTWSRAFSAWASGQAVRRRPVTLRGFPAVVATTLRGLLVVAATTLRTLLRTVLVVAELVVLGVVAWLVLRRVLDWLGWSGTDASVVAAVVCVGVAGAGLVRHGRGSGAGRPSALAALVAGLVVALLLWASVVVALLWGALGGVTDLAGAPSDPALPWRAGLVVCGVLVAQWLAWAADSSRRVDPTASRGSVTGWVVLGGAVPAVALMVAGIVVASRQHAPARLFGYLDAIGWGWCLMVPVVLAALATVYLRAVSGWAVVRADWTAAGGARTAGR